MKPTFLLALTLLPASLAAQRQPNQPDAPLQGGPAEGMTLGRVISRNGPLALVELRPSAPNMSPLTDSHRVAVENLLQAYDSGAELPRRYVAPAATSFFCAHEIGPQCVRGAFTSFPFGPGYFHNTPYQLQDGRVRVEWLQGRELRYVSIMQLDGAMVVAVDTLPPTMPVMLPAPDGEAPNHG